ncbi:SAM-dependent methyltransferase, partial [bacterium]|nr:SAM-dependent methyltransferase [bacterium]
MVESLTLRDPAGQLLDWQGRLVRLIYPHGQAAFDSVQRSAVLLDAIRRGRVTAYQNLSPSQSEALRAHLPAPLQSAAEGAVFVEHPRVWFPSYPYEWPAEMVHAAAKLTLDLAESLLDEGLGLKDATPYNVLFNGSEPAFVDLLSFEKRNPNESSWQAFGQFLRCFVYPLLASRHLGLDCASFFLTQRDGLEAQALYPRLKLHQKFRSPFFSAVTLPTWLGKSSRRSLDDTSLYSPSLQRNPELAQYILRGKFRYLRRLLAKAAPRPTESHWSGYMDGGYSYAAA